MSQAVAEPPDPPEGFAQIVISPHVPEGKMVPGLVVALDDVHAVWMLAKLGLGRMPQKSRVAPRLADAFRRVKAQLVEAGKLPK
jgi:hypothetical protein